MEIPETIEGWLHPIEIEWLEKTARTMNSVLEVGCWKGLSTHVFINSCNCVYSVDHFMGSTQDERTGDIFECFAKNVGKCPWLHVLKMSSAEASNLIPDWYVDMVFIDASHAYGDVKKDINGWCHKCRKMFCGHDYDNPDVERAVNEVLGKENVQRVHNVWWVLR